MDETDITWTGYYPEFGDLLPSGNLRVSTSGRDGDGVIWDGWVEITPDDPRFADWLKRWQNRGQYLDAFREETRQARRKRRDANRAMRDASRQGETP
jgi:hypothetical protein